ANLAVVPVCEDALPFKARQVALQRLAEGLVVIGEAIKELHRLRPRARRAGRSLAVALGACPDDLERDLREDTFAIKPAALTKEPDRLALFILLYTSVIPVGRAEAR